MGQICRYLCLCLWLIAVYCSAAAIIIGFYQPTWLEGQLDSYRKYERQMVTTTFGLWRRCNYYDMLNPDSHIVLIHEGCGRYRTLSDIPSVYWRVGSVLTGVGALFSLLCVFVLTSCVIQEGKGLLTPCMARSVGMLQFITGTLVGVACGLYPLGWQNNSDLLQACGDHVTAFSPGDCRILWTFWLTLAGAGCSILCSFLSCCCPAPRHYPHSQEYLRVQTL